MARTFIVYVIKDVNIIFMKSMQKTSQMKFDGDVLYVSLKNMKKQQDKFGEGECSTEDVCG
jgi:hypothetical protein